MRRRNVELRVGFLVIAAIVVMTTWLLFLKEFKFSADTFTVTVDFPSAAGLKPGAGVSILGVNRGKVRSVLLLQDRVRVELEIEEGTFLAEDARFTLLTDIFNPTQVRVLQGRATMPLVHTKLQRGDAGVDLGTLMSQGADLVASLGRLSARLDSLSGNGRLERLAGDLEGGVKELRAWTTESRGATRSLLERLDRLTGDLNGFIDDTRAPAGEAVANLGAAAARADTLAADLGQLTRSLTRLSESLESDQGSIGKAINSPVLHDSLMITVSRLDSLITEIRANPKKFVHFSLF